MRNQGFRIIISFLTVFLLTGLPTQAAPIVVSEVVQVMGNYQNAPDLRLRSSVISSDSNVRGFDQTTAQRFGSLNVSDWALNPTADSLLSGIAIGSDPQRVDLVVQDDVEGTICDCGEILEPGGFPKWPLVFLAGIPFIFIRNCETCNESPVPPVFPTPTPPTTTVPTPEPVSLLLFGTGLAVFGAGLRRRHSRKKILAAREIIEGDSSK